MHKVNGQRLDLLLLPAARSQSSCVSCSQSKTYRVFYVPREGDCDFESVGESQNAYDVIVNGNELKSLGH